MAKVSAAAGWQRALIVLTGTVVGVVVVSCLYWAQTVFVPVALALYLSFLLAPLVTILQRRGLGRMPSVVLVVLLAAVVLGGIGWLVTAEVGKLASDLPTYTENIKEKVRSLRPTGQGSIMDRLDKMIQEITGEWKSQPASPEGAGTADKPARPEGAAPEKQPTVVVQPESPAWLSQLPAMLGHVAESLGGLVLALVLVVFMLLKREDLRNRLIRLAGHGRLTAMTKAVDDAGQRISRYLLMQFVINASFGLVLAIGLLLIGVPHALLWGFLGGILRYVPYLGTWIMAAMLLTLSLAMFPGWLHLLLVLGLIAALELAAFNVLEPWLFRQSTGVSEVALLVAAAFWAFLWGPIGLVLSNPLTVCLVVLGKYIPQLEFLDVLLGDERVLDAEVSFYQRLLARDQDEATQLVLAQAKTSPPEQVFDEMLVPAMNCVRRDRERDDVTEADEHFVLRATREIVEDLGERQAAAAVEASEADEGTEIPGSPKVRVLACPCREEADALALEMLRQLLDPAKWEVEVLSVEMLSSELVALAGEKAPAVVCIGALPPGGLARTRYLCKRLRARLPHAKLVVGRWGLKGNVEENQEQLREAGADQAETTLLKTRDYLNALLPVLSQHGTQTVADGVVAARLPVG